MAMSDPKDLLYAIPIKQIAQLCRVDITTARRWKRGAICPPEYILQYIKAKVEGDLSFLDPAWAGWIMRDGHLYSPEGWRISMSDVLASRLHEAQLAAWRREVRLMKAEVEGLQKALTNAKGAQLDEQPTPDQWDVQILTG